MSVQLRNLINTKINEINPSIRKNLFGLMKLEQCNKGIELRLPLKIVSNDVDRVKLIKDEEISYVAVNTSFISFGISNISVNKLFKNPLNFNNMIRKPGKFIVEYSSPNIAKPFHVGHLRSTIIGSFISNLLKTLNHKVIQMNYLGDYGMQFGFLKVGIDMENLCDDEIQKNPLQSLLRVYIQANKSSDPSIREKAKQIFEIMEFSENEKIMSQWMKIRDYTMEELMKTYERLNIVYDVYEFESMYRRREIENVISLLKDKQILHHEEDGQHTVLVDGKKVSFIKSDDTTLYLTRDVAAFLSRWEKYEMEKVIYVVENSQHDHFAAIKSVLNQLGLNGNHCINHVKFGRIHGMSTRKGNIVFLKDILDEAKYRMYKKQQESKTTKVNLSECGESIADVLGVSAIVINDLKQRRQRDYDFEWRKILQLNGDTGIKFQYTHCRLFNLLQANKSLNEANELNLELLKEPEAQNLIFHILKYPEIIYHSYSELESCILVKYTFDLCNLTSKAFKILTVKNCECHETASQRLLLFNTTRKVLKNNLEILGLRILNKM